MKYAKASICDVRQGCINIQGMGDLHVCEGPIDVEAYIGAAHASIKTAFFLRRSFFNSAAERSSLFCTTYSFIDAMCVCVCA